MEEEYFPLYVEEYMNSNVVLNEVVINYQMYKAIQIISESLKDTKQQLAHSRAHF